MSISISMLDGCNVIGGNKILVGFDGKNVLFDFGTNYKISKEYYDSFLKEREARGIHDFVEMGMLPRLKIYRKELVTDDYRNTYSSFNEQKVDALFISHAHMDHIGMAGFLDLDIPFVATPMTAVLMKCIEDTGTGLGSENAYICDRVCHNGCVLYAPTKDKDGRKDDSYYGRRILLTEQSNGTALFMSEKPAKGKEIKGGSCTTMECLGIEARCFPVDHSIYGAAAHAIRAQDGWIVYSGDIRMHGRNRSDTERFIEEAAKLRPKVLIIEGTRTSRIEDTEAGSLTEDEVAANCLTACENASGLIVADFGARNFERLEIFANIAEKIDRTLVVTSKDAYFLESMARADGINRLEGLGIFDANRGGAPTYLESKIRDDHPDQFISPEEVRDNQVGYILSFSIWDMPHLLDIKPQGGTYIYSGSGSFDEEADFDFGRLDNWIRKLGMNAVGFEMVPVESHRGRTVHVPRFNGGLHASGHASKEELIGMIERIRPEYLVPVHTENADYFLENVTCVPRKNILLAGCDTKLEIN
jgi:ribonuclease J